MIFPLPESVFFQAVTPPVVPIRIEISPRLRKGGTLALIAAVLSVTGQGWIAPAARGQTQSKRGRANLVLEPTHCRKEAKRNKGNWRKWVFLQYLCLTHPWCGYIDPCGCRSRSCCQTICSISHGSNTALFIAPRMTQQSGETESLPLFINFMAVVLSWGGQR